MNPRRILTEPDEIRTAMGLSTTGSIDPVPTLTARWGETASEAERKIASLTSTLRELDRIRDNLAEHKIDVDVDLGPIGNAAAAARRDLEKERPTQFSFPKPR